MGNCFNIVGIGERESQGQGNRQNICGPISNAAHVRLSVFLHIILSVPDDKNEIVLSALKSPPV